MGKNWKARDRKQHKDKTGMRVSGRSLLTIAEIMRKHALDIQRRRDVQRKRSKK